MRPWWVVRPMNPVGDGPRTCPDIAGTSTCQLHHLGYSVSGVMHVETDDGQHLDIHPESVYEIPSGHDAWVVGDEPWVTVEWTSARSFGVAPEGPGERILATVLFTDIVDSTATMERIGDAAWRDLLSTHNRLLREELNVFRGREVATTGTDSWPSSMARPGPFAAASRCRNPPGRWDSRSVSAFTRARSSSSGPMLAVWPSTPPRESCHSQARARCSSRRRRRTSWRALASCSRMPEPMS